MSLPEIPGPGPNEKPGAIDKGAGDQAQALQVNGQYDGNRFNFFRCAFFLVIEGAYIAFAAYVLKHPHPLPDFATRFRISSVKAAIVTVSSAWHSLAGFSSIGVLADSFSRQWSVSRKSPRDRVSKVTSGMMDWVSHIWASTKAFKFTVFAWLCLFVLLRVGPSTIILADRQVDANITIGGLILGTSDMSHAVLKVEQALGLDIGYQIVPNWVIPKPGYNLSLDGGTVTYKSDLVNFSYSCQWHIPTFDTTTNEVSIGGETFDFGYFVDPPAANETTVGTGVRYLTRPTPSNSYSAFVVLGGNSTFPLVRDPNVSRLPQLDIVGEQATGNTIDLSNLPTSYNPSGYNFSAARFTTNHGNSLVLRAPLATGLLCDPHATLTGGKVLLSSNSLTVINQGSGDSVGNIDPRDIRDYFLQALDGINDPAEHISTFARSHNPDDPPGTATSTPTSLLVDFTPLAARLLSSQPPEGAAWLNATMTPLKLNDIAKNMNVFVSSVSKAQQVDARDHITGIDAPQGSGQSQVLASWKTQDQVITASLVYVWLTVGAAFATFFASVIFAVIIEKQNLPPFDLKHILEMYQIHADPVS